MNKYFLLLLLTACLFQVYGQSSTLTGTVTNQADSAIAGAEVCILPDGPVAVTDEAGRFSLVGLARGTVTVSVYAVGYRKHEEQVSLTRDITELNFRLTIDEQSLDQVDVTGRRINANTETLVKLENTIMPVTVIDRRTIELMGSRRLDEVMKEQTGVAIVNDIASGSRSVGVQMQGFGSEYVMVLIDGQPMVGRNGGNFDLSRISVSNIERVEITKGSAANIYGGDALGGTINVITRQVVSQPQALASVNYGSNETVDVSLDGEAPVLRQKGSVALNANYYHTGGFNTNQGTIVGTTAPPYDNYGAQGRFRYQFNEANRLSVSGRYGLRRSFMSKDFAGANYRTEDVLDEQDVNLSANFDHRFNQHWRSMTRYYFTRYHADMNVALSQGDSISQTTFGQLFNRLEQQVSYSIPEKLDVITGVGGSIEGIDQNILNDISEIKSLFAYSQANWNITSKLEFTVGLRYDHIVDYGWRLDPSAALQYQLLPTLRLKAAYGTAFKAPDMRKLYQVFYNPAYNNMVVGSYAMRDVINAMRESGQVSQYELEPVYDEIKGLALNAEMSKSYNVSLIWESPDRNIRAEGSVFHHDITNQINSVLIGRDVQGGLIYSYRNHAKAYFQGAELSLSYKPIPDLQVSGGYQYLVAKDRTVGDEIREGGKYYSPLFDPSTGFVNYTPSTSDYWGIENRSVHMFNARVFYTYQPLQLSANVRVNYRGRYPFSDLNNNGYMDRFDTFVRGHYLLNAGLEKRFPAQRMSLRLTSENMLDFVDQKVPSQPGRVYFVGLSYQLYRK
ncbi:TonB-dependent receptor [Parapedobacter koreensis]|uniref:Outer membrane receptor for ferrienterochelin and colicins n=1 Tax=Parapedobacter koreensis TaxID=332977 RepID=A0A1H7JPT3_9SPHI|nr:TonB-dependent receptor [Parapedobacter koreensis]SEK76532.1 outer membrane receptor for ferrienterochelin and colicins [Parapedobacter koreensis]